jgi:hypothetical protein
MLHKHEQLAKLNFLNMPSCKTVKYSPHVTLFIQTPVYFYYGRVHPAAHVTMRVQQPFVRNNVSACFIKQVVYIHDITPSTLVILKNY